MISRNFTLIRIAAVVINAVLSTAIILSLLMFTDIREAFAVAIGVLVSAFCGSFNVFEPKAVDIEMQKAREYYEAAKKLMDGE